MKEIDLTFFHSHRKTKLHFLTDTIFPPFPLMSIREADLKLLHTPKKCVLCDAEKEKK